MDEDLEASVIQSLKDRAKSQGSNYTIEQQYDYLVGAMQMYLLLTPESEKDGSWCPPTWVFGIMGGTDFTE